MSSTSRATKFRVRTLLTVTVSFVSLLGLTACDEGEEGNTNYQIVTGESTGCLQGVVYDGVNGSRVDLTSADMYVVTRDRVVSGLVKAQSFAGADSRLEDLAGEYVLCDVPFGGQQIPLYVNVDGYQKFTQVLTVPSRTPNRGNNNTNPGHWVWPTMLNDITLFKLADLVTNDYTVRVYKAGEPVENAIVHLVPSNVRMTAQGARTDANGIATFAASGLAFGQTYALRIFDTGPDSSTGGRVGAYGTIANITIGSLQTTTAIITAESVFSIGVDLGLANAAPMLVSSSPDMSVSAAGEVTFVFDRDVQADWDSVAGVTVTITDYGVTSTGADCQAADVGGVLGTPQITVATTGNTSVVTPRWTTAPTTTGCRGVQITYNWNTFGYVSRGAVVQTSTQIGGATQIYLTSPGQ